MKLLRRQDYPEGKFTLAFVGYQDERDGAVIELTHNWDTSRYDLGNGYGHIALEVDDAAKTCDLVRERGGKVTREAGPMKHGTTVIAFVEDPDGYKRSEEHTSELQSLMRISYAVFCLKKKNPSS